jgi:hypothetical protein
MDTQCDGHEVAGGRASRLLPFQAAPLRPEQWEILVWIGELLLQEQVGLGDDAKHPPGVVHHRHRAHPVLGEPGHQVLERRRRPDGHHLGRHQVLDQAVHRVLLVRLLMP